MCKVTKNSDDDVMIRRYQSEDLSQVKQIFIDGMKTNGSPDTYIRSSLASDLSSLEETYFKGRGHFWVMVRLSDNIIIGTVGLQDLSTKKTSENSESGEEKKYDENDEDTKKKNICELRRMSIHSSERRKGRGGQLIECFIEYARSQKFDFIILSTGGWMEAAISFYLSTGFQDMGRAQYNHEVHSTRN